MPSGPLLALLAAALFGLSAPAAKLLVGRVDPWLLAGLLYLGSGLGLGMLDRARRLGGAVKREAALTDTATEGTTLTPGRTA